MRVHGPRTDRTHPVRPAATEWKCRDRRVTQLCAKGSDFPSTRSQKRLDQNTQCLSTSDGWLLISQVTHGDDGKDRDS